MPQSLHFRSWVRFRSRRRMLVLDAKAVRLHRLEERALNDVHLGLDCLLRCVPTATSQPIGSNTGRRRTGLCRNVDPQPA